MPRLELENVCLDFPVYNQNSRMLRKVATNLFVGGKIATDQGYEIVRALDGISVSLRKGDAIGLVGHNGAGKTTLLRVMAGIYQPTSGLAIREGSVCTILELGAGLDQELSGRENIFRLGLLQGFEYQDLFELSHQIVEFSELGDFIDLPVRTFSAGMLTRLMFSIATARTPDILIIDEMISAGDEGFQVKARARMENLINNSSILVLASHSPELISQFCNRQMRLEHGKIIEELCL